MLSWKWFQTSCYFECPLYAFLCDIFESISTLCQETISSFSIQINVRLTPIMTAAKLCGMLINMFYMLSCWCLPNQCKFAFFLAVSTVQYWIKYIEKITATVWNDLRYLITLHIVWSLVRRRVNRHLTRLQTMYNVLKYCKTGLNNDKNSIYHNRNITAPESEILSIY